MIRGGDAHYATSGPAIFEERAHCVSEVAVGNEPAEYGGVFVPARQPDRQVVGAKFSAGRLQLEQRQWTTLGEPDESRHVSADQPNVFLFGWFRPEIGAGR